MAKVNKLLKIELSIEEKRMLDEILHAIYTYTDNDEEVGNIMCDIYSADEPRMDHYDGQLVPSTFEGIASHSIIIIKGE